MDRWNRLPLQILGVTLGVLAGLLALPATRWLVTAQFASIVPGRPTALTWSAWVGGLKGRGAEEAVGATHGTAVTRPNDYPIQLADALTAPSNKPWTSVEKTNRLRELAARFPDRPSVYANVLRFATQGAVRIQREEIYLFETGHPSPHHSPARAVNSADLRAYESDAAEGERIDPDNAYFPFMRAIGLFEGHRDTEALEALHRAAQKPLWREYYDDEMDGEVRLQDLTFGESGGLPRAMLAASLLFPQYASMRNVARVATARAFQEEQAGHLAEGIAIREDLLRCGGLMRAEGQSLIGNLVGSAIAQLALQRPEGMPAIVSSGRDDTPEGRAKHWQQLLVQYDAFLARAGHPEQSARAHGEAAAGLQIRKIALKSIGLDPLGNTLWQLGMAWWLQTELLAAVLLTAALGIAASLTYRHRALRSGQGLPQWAGRGAALGMLGAALSGVFVVPAGAPPTNVWLSAIVICGLLALALPAESGRLRLFTFGAYCASLIGSGVAILLLAGAVNATSEPLRLIGMFISSVMAPENGSGTGIPLWLQFVTPEQAYHLISVAALAAVPILAACAFLIVARFTRVPVSVAMVRGFRGCAAPIACGLFLMYAALLPITLRLESVMDDGLRNTVRHAGRYVSGLMGEDWPGRIP